MGAASKQARAYWLENLCREMRTTVERRGVAELPKLRQNGITIGEIAQHMGQQGLLLREREGRVFVAASLEKLGVKDPELTPAGYR
jgi:hypothetical protein